MTEAIRYGRYAEEAYRVRKDGRQYWAHVALTALRDGDGRLVGFAKVPRDLTEKCYIQRLRADLLASESHARARMKEAARWQVLASAGRGLSASLDAPLADEAMLRQVVDAAVPAVADGCAVYLVDPHAPVDQPAPSAAQAAGDPPFGPIRLVAVKHVDPQKTAWAEAAYARFAAVWNAAHGVADVLRTGRSQIARPSDRCRLSARGEG